jgi:hypothetical protein
MSAAGFDGLLHTFHRQVQAGRVARGAALALAVGLIGWSGLSAGGDGRRASLLVLMAGMGVWLAFVMDAVRLARQVQAGSVLIATGQLERAETWLTGLMERFTFSVRVKLLAAQQLASLYFRKGSHAEVVAICRELLHYRLGGLQGVAMNVRLMLADSLLTLERASEAYEALRPIYESPLSLSDQLRLLPVQLRYELATGHSAASVQGLPEKVRVAELMDPDRAGLAHALLAEACRRESLATQQAFLAERARLYADLAPMAAKYPVIAVVAAG